jgi:hypothetical protein
MKKLISSLLVVTMLASSAPAWADGPAQAAPTPPPIVTPLHQGQSAPWPGVLLSPPAVAQVVAQQDTAAAAIQLAVQHQMQLDAAQQKYALDSAATTCTADKTVLQTELTSTQKQNQILSDQLKKATSGPSTPVWVGIGFAGGVIVTVLTALAVSKATH